MTQGVRVRVEALEPGELVVELRSRLGIAVRQVDRCDDQALYFRLEVPSLPVGVVARQAAAHLYRPLAFCEDRHAVMRALAVPERAIAGFFQHACRTLLIGGLDLLQ